MAEVSELEQRIANALDRIESGLGGLAVGAGDSAEITALREALEAEQTANAQLEERVRAIKEKQETLVAGLEREIARLRDALAVAEADNGALKRVNDQLRENNRALREANARGVGDAGLINTGLVSELDALRVAREADRTEMDAILAELKPMVEGA